VKHSNSSFREKKKEKKSNYPLWIFGLPTHEAKEERKTKDADEKKKRKSISKFAFFNKRVPSSFFFARLFRHVLSLYRQVTIAFFRDNCLGPKVKEKEEIEKNEFFSVSLILSLRGRKRLWWCKPLEWCVSKVLLFAKKKNRMRTSMLTAAVVCVLAHKRYAQEKNEFSSHNANVDTTFTSNILLSSFRARSP